MEGRIIKIDNNQIVIRPCENFLDIVADRWKYMGTNCLYIGQKVDIYISGTGVVVTIDKTHLAASIKEES